MLLCEQVDLTDCAPLPVCRDGSSENGCRVGVTAQLRKEYRMPFVREPRVVVEILLGGSECRFVVESACASVISPETRLLGAK